MKKIVFTNDKGGVGKTTTVANLAVGLSYRRKKVLVVDSRENRNLYLSARNLPTVKMVASNGVNVYDLVNHEVVMISKKALLELQETLKS